MAGAFFVGRGLTSIAEMVKIFFVTWRIYLIWLSGIVTATILIYLVTYVVLFRWLGATYEYRAWKDGCSGVIQRTYGYFSEHGYENWSWFEAIIEPLNSRINAHSFIAAPPADDWDALFIASVHAGVLSNSGCYYYSARHMTLYV